MPYYRGDFYGGGTYRRGDPFIGALVAGAVKGIAGGAIGRAVGRAGAWIGKKAGSKTAQDVMAQLPGVGVGIAAAPILTKMAPGNFPALPAMPGELTLPWGGQRKKYRKMNPLNPRALKRALRRAEGFEKFAKKTVNALYKTVDGRRVKTYKRSTKRS